MPYFHLKFRFSALSIPRFPLAEKHLHKQEPPHKSLPSGISTDTGEVAEGAVRADLTVTFDSYKPLHLAETSAPLCGKIVCDDIGIRDEWHPVF